MAKNDLLLPGAGWDTESIVSGFIQLSSPSLLQKNVEEIKKYPFDEAYPFTNIFWGHSSAQYGLPVIGFTGSYKQIEEDWNEWLWKMSQLLIGLDALKARVNLDCILGSYTWLLKPRSVFEEDKTAQSRKKQWGIVEAPENDFCINPEWLAYTQKTWSQFVERWTDI